MQDICYTNVSYKWLFPLFVVFQLESEREKAEILVLLADGISHPKKTETVQLTLRSKVYTSVYLFKACMKWVFDDRELTIFGTLNFPSTSSNRRQSNHTKIFKDH